MVLSVLLVQFINVPCLAPSAMALTVTLKEYRDDYSIPPILRHPDIPNVSNIPRCLPQPRALHVSTALSASASGNPNAHIEQRTSPLPVLAVKKTSAVVLTARQCQIDRPVTVSRCSPQVHMYLGRHDFPRFPGTRTFGPKVKSSSCSKIRFVAAATPCSSPISRRGEHAMLE